MFDQASQLYRSNFRKYLGYKRRSAPFGDPVLPLILTPFTAMMGFVLGEMLKKVEPIAIAIGMTTWLCYTANQAMKAAEYKGVCDKLMCMSGESKSELYLWSIDEEF